jgi:hypothetical protein
MSDNDTPDNEIGPDPIDKAYVQAEAVLGDDARAARRARVLAAVAREPAGALAPVSAQRPVRRPGGWIRGGWLAAACVAGFGLFIATRSYEPALRQSPPIASTAPRATASAAAAPTPRAIAAPSPALSEPPKALAAPPRDEAPAAAASVDAAPPAPPPPPLEVAPERRAFPAAPAPAAAPPPSESIVTAKRAEPASKANTTGFRARGGMAGAFAHSGLVAAPPSRPETDAALSSDQGARLRAAAAGGRTAEVKALLDQGALVDAPDADGNTPLMKSIQADQPGVAALLRRHGASLDRKNHAGESAREMATAKDDAALNRALDLEP